MKGPVNALRSLDELIWKQFEKITQKAYKELGWNKYDLANLSDLISCTGFMMEGGFFPLNDLITKNFSGLFQDIVVFGVGYHLLSTSLEDNRGKEREELKKLSYDRTLPKPKLHWWRPPALLLSSLPAYLVTKWQIIGYPVFPELTASGSQNYTTNFTFAVICASTYFTGSLIASYFRDQNMTSPTTKKPFFKTMYEKINPFKGEMVPEEVKQNYIPLEEKISEQSTL